MEATEKLTFTVAYTESVDGGFVGYLTELPGVISQGETMEDLYRNLRDAMNTMFEYNKEKSAQETEGSYKTQTFSLAC